MNIENQATQAVNGLVVIEKSDEMQKSVVSLNQIESNLLQIESSDEIRLINAAITAIQLMQKNDVLKKAEEMQIATADQCAEAAGFLRSIKFLKKYISEKIKPTKDVANRIHKTITNLESKLIAPLDLADAKCSAKIISYNKEQARIAMVEQERLKKEAEAKAKADAEAQKKRDEDERLAAAQALEAQGFGEEAQALISEPVPEPIVMPVMMAPIVSTQKVDGFNNRKTYKAKVVDMKLFVEAVAKGIQPACLAMLLPNESVLNKMASAMKTQLSIPGVQVVEETGLSVRPEKNGGGL